MYLNSTDYEYKHIYDMDTLKDYCEYAARDIQRAYEAIEVIKKYQLGIYEHVQEVLNSEFKKFVVIERRMNYSSKRIEYFVHLDHRPMLENDRINGKWIYGKHELSKKFNGSDRHKAFDYAKELSRVHAAEIEKKGYWGKY